MLRWAIIFLLIALVLYVLGFTGIASFLTNIAWLFAILFVILLIIHLFTRGRAV